MLIAVTILLLLISVRQSFRINRNNILYLNFILTPLVIEQTVIPWYRAVVFDLCVAAPIGYIIKRVTFTVEIKNKIEVIIFSQTHKVYVIFDKLYKLIPRSVRI